MRPQSTAGLAGRQQPEEIFSDLCEDLWRGLETFAWRSSLRTWLYVLARHATARYLRAPHRRPERNLGTRELGHVAHQVRSQTRAHLKTEAKDAFAALRADLSHDDQTLLILRIDRRMSWHDIAVVLSGPDASDVDLKRETARLRKRFQLLKNDLRRRVRAAGLLAESDDG
jgi:RNA polymerase sigma-70 factor (ECF subfamily)